MLVTVADNQGNPVVLSQYGLEAALSRAGTILAANASQPVAAANAVRSGFLFQNQSQDTLYLEILGAQGGATIQSLRVNPGETLRMPRDLPLTAALISVLGPTAGAVYYALEW